MGGLHILTLLSSLFVAISFPRASLWTLAYIGLLPLLFGAQMVLHSSRTVEQKIKALMGRGFVFAFVFLGYFHSWMFTLSVWAHWGWIMLLWIGLCAYLSVFYGVAMGLYGWVVLKGPKLKWAHTLLFPSLWILAEWGRSLGPLGDPGGVLGYSQVSVPAVLQWASVVGVYGLSFFCVWVNDMIFRCLTHEHEKKRMHYLMVLTGVVLAIWAGGALLLHRPNPAGLRSIPIAIVQGNYAQDKKLDPLSWDPLRADILDYTKRSLETNPNHADFVFWPETITPTFNLNHTGWVLSVVQLAQKHKVNIVFGTPIDCEGRYYNGAVVIGPNGIEPHIYRKSRLMPFGEYWPGKKWLMHVKALRPVLGEDYIPAPHIDILPAGHANIGMEICLESAFPCYARAQCLNGADFLAIALNNAWFGHSFAADEHFDMTKMRAVESNRYVVIAGNTGISGVISPRGDVLTQSVLNTRTILTAEIKTGFKLSPYHQCGNSVVWAAGIFIMLLCFVVIARQTTGSKPIAPRN